MNREPYQCPACKHVNCTTGECQCDCDPVYEMHCRIAAATEKCRNLGLPVDVIGGAYQRGAEDAAGLILAVLEGR